MIIKKIINFYVDGFRNMTTGRILWGIILIKLFIMYFILKLFFFSDYVKEHKGNKTESEFIADELINRKIK